MSNEIYLFIIVLFISSVIGNTMGSEPGQIGQFFDPNLKDSNAQDQNQENSSVGGSSSP